MPAAALTVSQMYNVDKTPCQPSRKLASPKSRPIHTGEFVDMGTKLYQLELQLSQKDNEIKEARNHVRKYQNIIWPNGNMNKATNLDSFRSKYDVINEQLLNKERELRKEKKRSAALLHQLKTAKKTYFIDRKERKTKLAEESENEVVMKNKATQHNETPAVTKNAGIQCSLLVSKNPRNSASNNKVEQRTQNATTIADWDRINHVTVQHTPETAAVITSNSTVRIETSSSHELVPSRDFESVRAVESREQLHRATMVTKVGNKLSNNNGRVSPNLRVLNNKITVSITPTHSPNQSATDIGRQWPLAVQHSSGASPLTSPRSASRSVVISQPLPEPQMDFSNSQTAVLFATSADRNNYSSYGINQNPIKVTIKQDLKTGSFETSVQGSDNFEVKQSLPSSGIKSASVNVFPRLQSPRDNETPQQFNVTRSQNSLHSNDDHCHYSNKNSLDDKLFSKIKSSSNGITAQVPSSPSKQNARRVYEKSLYEYTRPSHPRLSPPSQIHGRSTGDVTIPFRVFQTTDVREMIPTKNHKPVFVHISELKQN